MTTCLIEMGLYN